MKTLKTGSDPITPITPASANLARALERDHLEWRGDVVVQAWFWTLMFAVAAVIVLVLLILAARAPAPPESKQAGQTERREPEEGMWLEVRDVLTTEPVPRTEDRRKPRRLDPPERIDR